MFRKRAGSTNKSPALARNSAWNLLDSGRLFFGQGARANHLQADVLGLLRFKMTLLPGQLRPPG